jgi:L-threonylcarbamoyladenylate synthase
MQEKFFEEEVQAALDALRAGKTILYPTDTVWGIGCDATNEAAVRRIYNLKKRDDSKSMILLVPDERTIMEYIAAPDPEVFTYMEAQERPTTIVFDGAIHLPASLVAPDGSIALRLVREQFCRHLLKRLRKPIVSTSANISGQPSPCFYKEISEAIKSGVDHIVRWRQEDTTPALPSRIIRWQGNGQYAVIRP